MSGRGWVIAIAGVAVLSAVAAMALLWTGSAMMAEANAYFAQFDFSTAGPVEIDQPEYDGYAVISTQGYNLALAAVPLLLVTVGAACVLLAVLAQRYDRTHRRAIATDQTEAPAAS